MAVNGKIPSSTLTKLSTPGSLLKPAAASFERLKKAAKTTGTEHSAEAYRSIAEQRRVFFENYDSLYRSGCTVANGGKKYYEGRWWYRKPGHATAAVPGTSNHGLGVAVDWQGLRGYGTAAFNDFAKHAVYHGWSNAEGKKIGEYWHWVYLGASKDKALIAINKAKAAAAAKAKAKAAARTKMKAAQKLLKVPQTGLPDKATLAAFNKCPNGATMKALQRLIGADPDGRKGPETKAKWVKFCAAAK